VSRCMAERSLGMPATITRSAACSAKQGGGELADRLAGRPLAHPDGDRAVADRHHVPALERGETPVTLGIAPPDPRAGEVGMEL
jgi:hypothetical protein